MSPASQIVRLPALLLAFTMTGLLHENKIPSDMDSKLEYLYSFPSDRQIHDGLYLWNARHLAVNRVGHVYVSDFRSNRIIVFDSGGGYLSKFGRKGQGPGEFLYPHHIEFTADEMFVNDTGNRRIQVFDHLGEFKRSLKTAKSYYAITMRNDGGFYAAPLRASPDDPLVDILDYTGKLVRSFGDSLKHNRQWFAANWIQIDAAEDGVILAFERFPILRKYSDTGELLFEIEIESEDLRKRARINIENAKKKGRFAWATVINAIQTYGSRVFAVCNHPRPSIYQWDEAGNPLNAFQIRTSGRYVDFDFLRVKTGILVYLLRKDDEDNIVEVFNYSIDLTKRALMDEYRRPSGSLR